MFSTGRKPHNAPQHLPQVPSMGILQPFTLFTNSNLRQGDESAPSPRGATSHREGRFHGVRIVEI